MAKKAKIVMFTLMTRVIVDDETDYEDTMIALAKENILAKIHNDELGENLETHFDDEELPFGSLETDE